MTCFAVLITMMSMKHKEKFEMMCMDLLKMDMRDFRSIEFSDICREHGADEMEMDNMFYSVFGMSGEDVLLQLSRSGMVLPI